MHCEYPADADDEYVTETGFQPTLPGESTKLSSALALFRASRILSKVLEELYPAKASYELSLKTLATLSDELDAWSASLPPHLRLQFAQDKPSTGTISSRSPLLSLTYHYIRALIQRPAICAAIGSRSSSHYIAMASSCKHMVQIVQLLEERGMSFSFCLNRDELLVLAGFGLLFQNLNLESNSKILKDNQKMVNAVSGILKKSRAPCASEFGRVVSAFLPPQPTKEKPAKVKPAKKPHALEETPPVSESPKALPALSRHNSDSVVIVNPVSSLPASTRNHIKAIASRLTSSEKTPKLDSGESRRATVHNISLHPKGVASQSQPSLQPAQPYNPSSLSRSEPARSPVNMYSRPSSTSTRPSAPPPPPPPTSRSSTSKSRPPPVPKTLNLDYLAFDDEPAPTQNKVPAEPVKPEPQPTDWERLLGSLDNGTTNIFDACYGGPAIDALRDSPALGTMQHANPTATAASDASLAWNNTDL